MYYAGFAVILVKKNMIVIGKHYSLIRLVQALFQLSKSCSRTSSLDRSSTGMLTV